MLVISLDFKATTNLRGQYIFATNGQRQLAYVKRGKDHHKTFDDLSRYVDGIVDELMFQYCKAAEGEPTVGGFLAWIGEKKGIKPSNFSSSSVASMALGSCCTAMA